MKLIDRILGRENMLRALKAVKRNKGAAGIDKVTVEEFDEYFRQHWTEMKTDILNKKYKPQPVRRVYIPKANGKKRPLGIPTVADRVQELVKIFDPTFSDYSHGFRPQRSCHTAMEQVLQNLNDGYEWVVDLDIEKYFDTVNHDKLISILREKVNDAATLNLIRRFLKAGIMENGVVSSSKEGVPQGGPLSPILSNIYLDKLDKELETRGLRFVRYADDVNVFVKSEMAANRVMKSVVSWLERKLFLKASAEKTKVKACYEAIPRQLAKELKKFQYSTVEKGKTSKKYGGSIRWLVDSALVHACYNIHEAYIPLMANAKEEQFKLYINDTGLLCAMYGFETKRAVLNNTIKGTAKGGIYENIIAESLVKNGYKLYYYKPDDDHELEFLVEKDGEVVPIEVKAGNTATVSLNNFIKRYEPAVAYKLINGNVGIVESKKTIPHYMVMFL